jgi:hypothetical protein
MEALSLVDSLGVFLLAVWRGRSGIEIASFWCVFNVGIPNWAFGSDGVGMSGVDGDPRVTPKAVPYTPLNTALVQQIRALGQKG